MTYIRIITGLAALVALFIPLVKVCIVLVCMYTFLTGRVYAAFAITLLIFVLYAPNDAVLFLPVVTVCLLGTMALRSRVTIA